MVEQQGDDSPRGERGTDPASATDDLEMDPGDPADDAVPDPDGDPSAGFESSAEPDPDAEPPAGRPTQDRFERRSPGSRVGAHRFVARPRRAWYYVLAAAVGAAILTGAGILAVQGIGAGVTDLFEGEKPEEVVKQVQAQIDPEATVAVLNGTETVNLEAEVAQAITKNEWGQIGFAEVAAARDVQISAVFYTSVTDEAAALGLAQELGGVSIYQSYDYTKYGVQLVVLLGADYAGPGLEEAQSEE